jgi:hypothetical protein
LKNGTGPVSQLPSGVAPAPSNVGVIIPPGHSLFAAHVNGVGTPWSLPRRVCTNTGVWAKCGVLTCWNVGGDSRVDSTGVPKPSS